ncbi:MAG: APC family permease [Chloroflexi bacterium]|nr:APC family permease [Chloroflexota bacterium]
MKHENLLLRGTLLAMGLLALVTIVGVPVLAQSTPPGEETIFVNDDLIGDQFYAVNPLVINGTIDGDVMYFGESLVINGRVTGDILFAGAFLNIQGEVSDDVRAAGAFAALGDGGDVLGSIYFAGLGFDMGPSATVGDDASLAATSLVINDVGGDLRGAGSSLRINGTVGGDITFEVEEGEDEAPPWLVGLSSTESGAVGIPAGISFGPDGAVEGDLTYLAENQQQFASSAVGGEVDFQQEEAADELPELVRTPGLAYLGYFMGIFLVFLVVGMLLRQIGPKFLNGTRDTLRERALASFGVGFLAVLGVTIILVILSLLMVWLVVQPLIAGGGLAALSQPLAGVVLVIAFSMMGALLVLMRWVAPVIFAMLFGGRIYSLITRENEVDPFWAMFSGLIVLAAFLAIPILGRPILANLIGMIGLGAIILYAVQSGSLLDTATRLGLPRSADAETKPAEGSGKAQVSGDTTKQFEERG